MINPFETIDARLSNIENLLLNLKISPKEIGNQLNADQLLTIQEAANFLHLSVPTIYGYVSKNNIPFSKKGKRLYFSKQELTDWVKTGRKKTIAEISAEANTYLTKRK